MHRLARASQKIRGALAETFDLRDAFWIGGLAATSYGIAQIYIPAAWIVCGAALFWMGVRR